MSAVLNIDTDEHMLIGQVLVAFRSRRYLELQETPPGRAGVGLGIYCGLVRRRSIASRRSALFRRRTGKVFAERMLYTMASPEFGRSGLRRLDEADRPRYRAPWDSALWRQSAKRESLANSRGSTCGELDPADGLASVANVELQYQNWSSMPAGGPRCPRCERVPNEPPTSFIKS